MGESKIDRLVAASVYQAIADCLPLQLEFYETWLAPTRWLKDGLSRGSLSAVLSFLRREGDSYADVMIVAGRYTAQWVYDDLPWRTRVAGRRLQSMGLRRRTLVRLATRLVRNTDRGSRVRLHRDNGLHLVEIRGSAFCHVREKVTGPLCQYYAAALEQFFLLDQVECSVGIRRCQAAGEPSCTLEMVIADRASVPVVRQAPVVHPRMPGGELL
jgi:hypothetical protein